MASSGYTITGITDIPITGNVANVVEGQQGITLRAPSRVKVFLNRESVDVLVGVNIGGTQVLEAGSPVPINATVGDMPSTQDDLYCEVMAMANDLIVVSATNANAALQEVRVLIQVMPIDDVVLGAALRAVKGIS